MLQLTYSCVLDKIDLNIERKTADGESYSESFSIYSFSIESFQTDRKSMLFLSIPVCYVRELGEKKIRRRSWCTVFFFLSLSLTRPVQRLVCERGRNRLCDGGCWLAEAPGWSRSVVIGLGARLFPLIFFLSLSSKLVCLLLERIPFVAAAAAVGPHRTSNKLPSFPFAAVHLVRFDAQRYKNRWTTSGLVCVCVCVEQQLERYGMATICRKYHRSLLPVRSSLRLDTLLPHTHTHTHTDIDTRA